ncbi:hypothetical protein [Streptomyces noursei]|nr:hypothetical protein [Streptomyces noursei]QRX96292.1 hypothetical protein JNO44_40795 [Streptomyces noursei]
MTEAFPARRARPDRARHRELPPRRVEFAVPGRTFQAYRTLRAYPPPHST